MAKKKGVKISVGSQLNAPKVLTLAIAMGLAIAGALCTLLAGVTGALELAGFLLLAGGFAFLACGTIWKGL